MLPWSKQTCKDLIKAIKRTKWKSHCIWNCISRCLNLRQYLRVYNSLRAQTAAVREFEDKKAAVDGAAAAGGEAFELNSKVLDQVSS